MLAAIEASAREELLLQQIELLQDRLQEKGASATQARASSATSTADSVTIAAVMKPEYSGLASLLQAAAPAAPACQARGGEYLSLATNAVQPAASIGATAKTWPALNGVLVTAVDAEARPKDNLTQ